MILALLHNLIDHEPQDNFGEVDVIAELRIYAVWHTLRVDGHNVARWFELASNGVVCADDKAQAAAI